MRDMHDAMVGVAPDHVERNERVLHPEWILARLREEKNHSAVIGEMIPIHQTLCPHFVIRRNFDRDDGFVRKDDSRRGRVRRGSGR
jgi:hypothetical protein